MRIRILGSAAGGGLPQWNCCCANCAAARAGSPDVRPRTQSSVAVSADGRGWFLLNVSADVRQQILQFPELGPPLGNLRGTSIAGCILTDAEIDHTSGLLQLREGCTFPVVSTSLVHRWLTRDLPLLTVVAAFAHRPWIELTTGAWLELALPNGVPSGLVLRAFETGRDVPRFVTESAGNTIGARVGLQIRDQTTGGVLVYSPGIGAIDEPLLDATHEADCTLLDGTFWSDDEPIQTGISNRTARQMGHVPIDGPSGSLIWLSGLPARYRAYVHINNTNPILNQRSPQRCQVTATGVQVAADGDEIQI